MIFIGITISVISLLVYGYTAVMVPLIFQISLHHFPIFQNVFKVTHIGWAECLFFLVLTLIPVSAVEIRKYMRGRSPNAPFLQEKLS